MVYLGENPEFTGEIVHLNWECLTQKTQRTQREWGFPFGNKSECRRIRLRFADFGFCPFTRHRYLSEPSRDAGAMECGDSSPLWPLGRLVGQAEPDSESRLDACPCVLEFNGDKSPAQSGDESPHSTARGSGSAAL